MAVYIKKDPSLDSLSSEDLIDSEALRAQFPILQRRVHGKPLIYFDSAATALKPACVVNAVTHYYTHYTANIARSVHTLSSEATIAVEEAREKVQQFINAQEAAEIIFTTGTTESINLVASTYGHQNVQPGDHILITQLEHHSNIVPWQCLCQARNATLHALPVTDAGELDMEALASLLALKPKIVSIAYVSSTLGTVNPIQAIVDQAHAQGAVVVVDAAQAVPHLYIDVQALQCDFLAFSAHKVYGPTGVGVLYGKRALLEAMPPYKKGGGMIQEVTWKEAIYQDIPYKFEAGTPGISSIVGFKAALDFVTNLGFDRIKQHEDHLLHYATAHLSQCSGVEIIGAPSQKVGILSFLINGLHPADVGMFLDAQGIAVRTGTHCARPLMKRLALEEGTVRLSFGLYNTISEVERLLETVNKLSRKGF